MQTKLTLQFTCTTPTGNCKWQNTRTPSASCIYEYCICEYLTATPQKPHQTPTNYTQERNQTT